ncbi:MAG: HlyD family type I secretion periplasmic adaptor subunit [Micavibrio sp.]|nr:HlyD family type I secretion periplasmic adaptor subunit [Micavibrio sp.]
MSDNNPADKNNQPEQPKPDAAAAAANAGSDAAKDKAASEGQAAHNPAPGALQTPPKPKSAGAGQGAKLPVANAGKKLDMSSLDLRKLDLTRKYDDDFAASDGVAWRDHVMLYTIGGLLLIALAWANIATLDEVSRGDGRVVPSSEVQAVQNLEGGIIEQFFVHEGEEVKEGQVLLQMRNIQAKADFDATTQKYLGLMATLARLTAESSGTVLGFPDEVKQGAPDSVRAEQNAYDANKKQIDNQSMVFQDQLSQKQQEVNELNRRIADTSSVLSLANDEKNMVEPMVAKGAANKKELLEVRQRIASQSAELNGLRLALPRSQSAVKEVKSRLDSLNSDFRAAAQKEFAEKTIEFNTIKQTLAAYKDKSERTEIKSPVHGMIKDLKLTTVGGVVKPGETIMEIVPSEDQLIVEARIKPSDIAFIHEGQRAIVRLTAFDFGIYGSLDGEVTEVSPDSIVNDKGESFYRVRVKTAQTQVHRGGKTLDVKAGMQATVDIVTGEKTVMRYILKPFNKAAQTAMRER